MPAKVGDVVHFVTTGGYPDQPGTCHRAEVIGISPDTHTDELHLKVQTSGGGAYEKREIRHDSKGKIETWHYNVREHAATGCYAPTEPGPEVLPMTAFGGKIDDREEKLAADRLATAEERVRREAQEKEAREKAIRDGVLKDMSEGEEDERIGTGDNADSYVLSKEAAKEVIRLAKEKEAAAKKAADETALKEAEKAAVRKLAEPKPAQPIVNPDIKPGVKPDPIYPPNQPPWELEKAKPDNTLPDPPSAENLPGGIDRPEVWPEPNPHGKPEEGEMEVRDGKITRRATKK